MPILRASQSGLVLPGVNRPQDSSSFAVTRGLIAYWPLSTDTVDITNNRILDFYPTRASIADTAASMSAANWTQGQVGTAYNFPSPGAGPVLSPTITNGSSFTICCWVKLNAHGGTGKYGTVLATSGGNNGFYIKGTGASTTIIDYFASSDHQSATSLVVGAWTHCAISVNAGAYTFYLNAVADGTGSGIGSADTLSNIAFTASQQLNAGLQELRFHNVALTQGEILEIYQAGLAGCRDSQIRAPAFDDMMALFVAPGGATTPWIPPMQGTEHLMRQIEMIRAA